MGTAVLNAIYTRDSAEQTPTGKKFTFIAYTNTEKSAIYYIFLDSSVLAEPRTLS
ncbi:hypothetical protein BFJ68_g15974 [Fusarium oxysporum]|uniref:Uncharacterized protein n=1 Tax=Fusarium oxysporum TaxID=5507 RepID=A0A420NMQ0_FUSOX|nr:hypothetical protein BFJ71_g15573 [Fusarium oxysporum]RKK92170.1 hypothetical protein BFJ68_g15974 [Fusarium oxysporum]